MISVKRRVATTHKDIIATYLSRLANFVSYSSNLKMYCKILCSTLFCSKTCGIGAEDRKDSLNELSPSIDEAVTYTNDTLRITDEYLREIAV